MRNLRIIVVASASTLYLFIIFAIISTNEVRKSFESQSLFLSLVPESTNTKKIDENNNLTTSSLELPLNIRGIDPDSLAEEVVKDFNPDIANTTPSLYNPYKEGITFMESQSNTLDENSISCKVQEYTFSEEEMLTYWRFRPYGKCVTKVKANISIVNNIINATCANGEIPWVHLDDRTPETLGGRIPNPQWLKGSVFNLENSQFVLVKCDPVSIHAHVLNHFDTNISKRTKYLSNIKSATSKPLAILLLVLDSVSKDSANRNLKNTVRYLKEQIAEGYNNKYSFYDFDIPNSAGVTTRENMIGMLYGQSLKHHEKILKSMPLTSDSQQELQKDALWTYFASQGYVTYFSFDTVFDYLAASTGRVIKADHVFNNFWRVAKSVYGYNDHLESQRCMGEHNAHYFSLNYTYQFFENYRNHNRFGYAHITAAHEDTGNIRTVDDDLKDFLESMFQLFNNGEEDLAIFLVGDHGRGMKELEFNAKGYYESILPMTFLIVNKELEQRIESKVNLKHNSRRLMGRYDINLSLKMLGYEPYGGYDQEQYEKFKTLYPVEDVVSLFHDKISDERTCKDIGVEEDYCICKEYVSVDLSEQSEQRIFDESIALARIYLNTNQGKCEDIQVVSINSARKIQLKSINEGWNAIYSYDIELQYNYTLSITASLITKSKAIENMNLVNQGPYSRSAFFIHHGIDIVLKITELKLANECNKLLCIQSCEVPSTR